MNNGKGKGAVNMDNDKILEIYIQKVDKDQSELKQDMRDSEARIFDKVSESEERIDKKFDKIQNLLEKHDQKLDNVMNVVNNKMDENRKFMWGIVITILLSIIASIGVIVATYQSSIGLIRDYIVK